MLHIAASLLLVATTPSAAIEESKELPKVEIVQEIVVADELENSIEADEADEIVFDDSITDIESELIEE